MLVFSSQGGLSLTCAGAERTLVVFPAAAPKEAPKNSLVLMPTPEEEMKEGIVSWPGEYNKGGVSIHGIGHEEGQQISYVVSIDGVRCAFLSSPLQEWTDKQLESVGDVDVLALPADDLKLSQKLIDEFDPRVLIILPSKNKDTYDSLAKVVGVKSENIVSEYKLKAQLPAEGREVVVLRK